MKLQLDRPDVLAPTQRFPELDGLQEQLRFGHRIEIRSRALPLDALDVFARCAMFRGLNPVGLGD